MEPTPNCSCMSCSFLRRLKQADSLGKFLDMGDELNRLRKHYNVEKSPKLAKAQAYINAQLDSVKI